MSRISSERLQVNNAGIAGTGSAATGEIEMFDRLMDINVRR